jgi:hypothetical protein
MEMFGEDFSGYKDPEEIDEAIPEPTAPQGQTDVAAPAKSVSSDPSKGKKGKLAAKSTGLQYQFQIMELIGIPRNEIKKFAEPEQWMKYFPPIAKVSPSSYHSYEECSLSCWLHRKIATLWEPVSTGGDLSLPVRH